MKLERIVSSETSEIRNQTQGNYPKRNKLHFTHCLPSVLWTVTLNMAFSYEKHTDMRFVCGFWTVRPMQSLKNIGNDILDEGSPIDLYSSVPARKDRPPSTNGRDRRQVQCSLEEGETMLWYSPVHPLVLPTVFCRLPCSAPDTLENATRRRTVSVSYRAHSASWTCRHG